MFKHTHRIEGNFLNKMKGIYEIPMASIIFTVRDRSLSPEIKNKQDKTRLPAFTTAIQKHTEVLVRVNRQEIKGIQIQMKKAKL